MTVLVPPLCGPVGVSLHPCAPSGGVRCLTSGSDPVPFSGSGLLMNEHMEAGGEKLGLGIKPNNPGVGVGRSIFSGGAAQAPLPLNSLMDFNH